MKYSEFYKKANQKLAESISNMWFKGTPDIQEKFKDLITQKEPLISEPIFQTIFPWKVSNLTFGEHCSQSGLLTQNFVQKLSSIDSTFKFPADRYPYSHQEESWETLLNDHKSIVVTSGTNSGKTECFMVPILQDIVNNSSRNGIHAIFLYPLNALMSDQRDRLNAWCKALSPKITHALYNRDTPESQSQAVQANHWPELVCRDQIRQNPPKILFTNPTMLNYMLLRKTDSNILEISAKEHSLKWIVLDEAHTYTGSAATELALQLRRVITAFGADIKDINFAVTSATISGTDTQSQTELLEMVSNLTGKDCNDIKVLNGERIIPELNGQAIKDRIEEMNRTFDLKVSEEEILDLRKMLNESPSLSLTQICNKLKYNYNTIEKGLELVDFLGEKVNGLGTNNSADSLLPTREHLFVRALNGLFVCTNDHCNKGLNGTHIWDNMTTYQTTECPHCKAPMLEMVACKNCGELFLTGEEDPVQGYHMSNQQHRDDFELFDEDEDSLDTQSRTISSRFFINKSSAECPRSNFYSDENVFLPRERQIGFPDKNQKQFVLRQSFVNNNNICPCCGQTLNENNVKSFFVGAPFLGTQLAESILSEADVDTQNNSPKIHKGQKYITFTDSRNTTAKSAMNANLNVENRWTMTFVYHSLLKDHHDHPSLSEIEQHYLDFLTERNMQDNQDYERLKNKQSSMRQLSFQEMKDKMMQDAGFRSLFNHISETKRIRYHSGIQLNDDERFSGYASSLLLNIFNRLPKQGNTLETLGLAHLVYPRLAQIKSHLHNIDDDEWRNFLKVCIDYFVRDSYCYIIPHNASIFFPQGGHSNLLFGPHCTLQLNKDKSKWPNIVQNNENQLSERQGRLIHLVSILLGYKSIADIDPISVNNVLNLAWKDIRNNVLTCVDTSDPLDENHGYKLNFEDDTKVKISLTSKGWLCPVEHAIVDTLIRGFSPRIKGYLNEVNFNRYLIDEPASALTIPLFPYPFLINPKDGQPVTNEQIQIWINSNYVSLKEKGVYSDIIDDIMNFNSIYITAEHSAQISSELRKETTEKFKNGLLNVMACSTTMEMGVDISGISEVIMNTIPPKPANYLQRAGRAGRRNESKAMAITFCSATPIGMNAWNNPQWPLCHSVQIPQIKMESKQIIQRNVNSMFFSSFMKNQGGMEITSNIADFFVLKYPNFLEFLNSLFIIPASTRTQSISKNFEKLCKGTVLESSRFEESVIICLNDIKRLFEIYSAYIRQYTEALDQAQPGTTRYKAIEYQMEKYKMTDLISFLAENSFIPAAGIPIGLIEFRTHKSKDYDTSFPSKHISAAISEYAPGNQVIINEWCYKSAGIGFKSTFQNADQSIIQRCTDCGYTTIAKGTPLKNCPCCNSTNMRGVFKDEDLHQKFTETVEPSYFMVNFNDTSKRSLHTKRIGYITPILLRMRPWSHNSNHAKCMIRSSVNLYDNERPEILYFNKGEYGMGYAICPYCGKVESENDFNEPNLMHNHQSILENQICEGNGHIHNHVIIVGSNQTDFVEMKFYDNDNHENTNMSLLYTLGEILTKELTTLLGINEGEIGYGINKEYNSLFIYDTAIGGAGYSTLFADYKDQVFDLALTSLSSCDCQKACTKCLINRHSQWHIDNLDRQLAIDWLKMEKASRTAPDDIRQQFKNVNTLTSDFSSEILKILHSSADSLKIFISNDIRQWTPFNFPYHQLFCQNKSNIPISYAIQDNINLNQLPASNMAYIVDILMDMIPFCKASLNNFTYTPLMLVKRKGFNEIYFSKNTDNHLNASWGQGEIYYARIDGDFQFTELDKFSLLSSLQDNYVALHFALQSKKFKTSNLLSELMKSSGDNNKWTRIATEMQDKHVQIIYTDKFLNSAFSTYILINLISQVVSNYKLKLDNIIFNLGNRITGGNNNETEFEGPYLTLTEQEETIMNYCKKYLNITPEINRGKIGQHERDIIFRTDTHDFVLLPNGGIGWGLQKDNRSIENATITRISDINNDTDLDLYIPVNRLTYTITMKKNQ